MAYNSNVDFSGFSASLLSFMRSMYPQILRRLRYSDTMSQYLTTINAVEGVYQITNATVSALLQGYQTLLTAKGKVSANAELIYVKRYKGDFPYDPVSFYDRWVSHLEENQLTPEKHPFEAYVLEMVLEQMVEDIQLNSAKGLHKEPVEGVATQAKHAFNGWLTELRRLVKEGKAVPVKTGSFTANTIVPYIEDFVDLISDLYQNQEMKLLTSIKNARAYAKDYRADFGDKRLSDSEMVYNKVFDSNMTVMGDSSLFGEGIIMATPKTNFMRVNSIRNAKPVEAQRIGRVDWILQDGGIGFGFGLPEIIFFAGEFISAPTARAASSIAATTAEILFEEVPGATGYVLDVSTAADFSSFVIEAQEVTIPPTGAVATALTLPDGTVTREYLITAPMTGLTTGTVYYARLRSQIAVDSSATVYDSENSNVVSFETA